MIRILRLLLAIVALIIVVTFAVANNQPVDVSFLPLPQTIELPLYGVFLCGLVVGALVGGLIVWFNALSKGRQARRMRRKVWALENQLSLLKRQEDEAEAQRYSGDRRALATSG